MTVYFISDIHLKEQNPQVTRQFFYFLREYARNATALYILGDLFEQWIGDDDHTVFNDDIMAALAAITAQSIPVFFIHGNRDFLIGKKFARATGVQLLAEQSVVEHYGKKLLLMHGDTLCTRDVAYQKARKNSRNVLFKTLCTCLPLAWRKQLAAHLRKESNRHQRDVGPEILDADEAEIEKVMTQYHADYLIHGHTHRPSIQLYYHGTEPAQVRQRIVLSDWDAATGNYLQLDAVNGFSLMYF